MPAPKFQYRTFSDQPTPATPADQALLQQLKEFGIEIQGSPKSEVLQAFVNVLNELKAKGILDVPMSPEEMRANEPQTKAFSDRPGITGKRTGDTVRPSVIAAMRKRHGLPTGK